MNENFSYTGREELEQALALPRYNAHIAGLFLSAIRPGQALLDFGAGIGTISERVRAGAAADTITCVEIDPENIAALKQKGFSVVGEVAALPPGSIDVVYSSNVLEHIEDDLAMLEKIRAALRPGGHAVFWVPAFKCLWTPMDDRVGHFRRYTRASMEDVFRRAGFKVEKCFYQDSLGFFVTLLFKMIGSKDGRVSVGALKIYDNIIFPLSRLGDFIFSRLFGKNVVIFAVKD